MAKDIITVKGSKRGLIFYFNTDGTNLEELYTALKAKLAEGAAFFCNSNYIIAENPVLTNEAKSQIEEILTGNGMKEAEPVEPVEVKLAAEPVYESEPAKGVAPMTYSAKEGDTVFVRRSIRSGQSLHIQGNVVIMGDVNIGGHVMATGNIIVMGTLRGIAHAGIQGDKTAFILAWKMQPIQLRIANMLSRSEDDDDHKADYAEKASIDGAAITIKPYEASKRLKMKKIVIA